MISASKKIIFLHIPKTAGTSLKKIIRSQFDSDSIFHLYPPVTTEKHISLNEKINRIELIHGHLYFGIGQQLDIDADYFTFLREPVARVLSFWNHQNKFETGALFNEVKNGLTLQNLILSHRIPQTNNHMTRILIGNTLPHMLDGKNNAIFDRKYLDQALSNIENCFKFVGFMEHFETSVGQMLKVFNWKYGSELPILNRLNSNQSSVDEKTLDLIRKYNALDSQLYAELLASSTITKKQ
ncbi:MAG: hypothetical protein C0631_09445 [Sedimenticola sp.]|nr:MAG: hypothetical protein C0631_09445 [Sedimenticola sp.]